MPSVTIKNVFRRREESSEAGRLFLAFFLLGLLSLPWASSAEPKTAPYLYEDTRQLVELVEDAAELVEQKGTAAFKAFSRKDSRWLNDRYYVFVYDRQGTCLFHPIEMNLIGCNLVKLRDMNGKPVVQSITEVAQKPEADAHGWFFYLWEEKTQFIPMWKSSYVRKAVGPDGKIYLVGCGIYNIKMERKFIEERVNQAAELLRTQGKEAAFQAFRDTALPFYFLDTYIFVMDMQGRTLVDPAYPTLVGRDLTALQDAMGFYVIRELIRKLRKQDEAWVQYMWPKPGSPLPVRKLVYARKVTVNNETFIVGSDFYVATPIWMED